MAENTRMTTAQPQWESIIDSLEETDMRFNSTRAYKLLREAIRAAIAQTAHKAEGELGFACAAHARSLGLEVADGNWLDVPEIVVGLLRAGRQRAEGELRASGDTVQSGSGDGSHGKVTSSQAGAAEASAGKEQV